MAGSLNGAPANRADDALATRLAHWASQRMVNRTDAWGQYRHPGQRSRWGVASTKKGELTLAVLEKHFLGASQGHLVGLHSTSAENTCSWVAADLDQHGDDLALGHRNFEAVVTWYSDLVQRGFRPLLTASNGRGGFHLVVLFAEPVESPTAFEFARWITRDALQRGLSIECYPKQSALAPGEQFGNWLRLPGRHHSLDFWSNLWDGSDWLPWAETAESLLSFSGDSPTLITGALDGSSSSSPAVNGSALPLVTYDDLGQSNDRCEFEASLIQGPQQRSRETDQLPLLTQDELGFVHAAIEQWIVTGPGQRQLYLFQVARQWLTLPKLANVRGKHFEPFVRRWWELSVANCKDKLWDETWSYFLRVWDGKKIKHPFGAEALNQIVQRACELVPNLDERLRFMQAVCLFAQRNFGDRPFPMASRALAAAIEKITGRKVSAMTVNRDLHALISLDKIKLIRRGWKGHGASMFRYIGEEMLEAVGFSSEVLAAVAHGLGSGSL